MVDAKRQVREYKSYIIGLFLADVGKMTYLCPDDLALLCRKEYNRGLHNWPKIKGYLMDTCFTAQDNYKVLLDYFKIKY